MTQRPVEMFLRTHAAAAMLAAASCVCLHGCASWGSQQIQVPEPAPVVVAPLPAPRAPVVPIASLPADSLLGRYDDRSYPRVESHWVDSLMTALPLRARVAQMMVVFTYSDAGGKKLHDIRRAVSEQHIGGVIISLGSVGEACRLVDTLQAAAQVPLLISADFEAGLGGRLRGGTEFPSMMALGAADDPDLAYAMGRAIADEARAIGVHQNFAPVADVNSNPANPVINIRSFGEDPARVAVLAEAYMRGLQDGRMIATAKHFPGHGDTDVDSHSELPTLAFTRERLDSVELVPFRHLVDAGVLAVMSGHVASLAYDADGRPATTSRAMLDTLLRGRFGFRGMVITDALNMKAFSRQNAGTMWKEAVLAGADMLLMPTDLEGCIDTITAAVQRGEIPIEHIDRSVRRILSYKEWIGLDGHGDSLRSVARSARGAFAADTAAHRALASAIAHRAVTLVRNDSALVPLHPESMPSVEQQVRTRSHSVVTRTKRHGHARIIRRVRRTAAVRTVPVSPFTLVSVLRGREDDDARMFASMMRAHIPHLRHVVLDRSLSQAERRAAEDSLTGAEVILVASYLHMRNGSGELAASADQKLVLDHISALTQPAVLIAFGSPYVVSAMPWARAVLCGFGSDPATLQAAADVLTGQQSPQGHLPVSLPGCANRGAGITAASGIAEVSAQERTADSARFTLVDSLIEDRIRRHAFPGGQLVVGRQGRIVHARAYGRLSYDADASPVTLETMYDLASLTKVVATTTVAMKLVDDGRLDLDATVVRYLPEFGRNGKEQVTVRNLLLHNAGLPAFRLYYTFARDARTALDTILSERLEYIPGTRTVYSDLGFITLGTLMQRITGLPLDTLAHDLIFAPLAMTHTRFTPPDSIRLMIAPTERDTVWRHRLVQGTVHDETSALLGGVAGHAGLFSTAPDLANFAQMLLDGGVFNGTRIVSPDVVQRFTRRTATGGSRALGWDTKSSEGSSAGHYFSARSFGHTGFTGTSIWIDPETGVFVVFLTNRVHPTRENRALLSFRAVLHDAVREALSNAFPVHK